MIRCVSRSTFFATKKKAKKKGLNYIKQDLKKKKIKEHGYIRSFLYRGTGILGAKFKDTMVIVFLQVREKKSRRVLFALVIFFLMLLLLELLSKPLVIFFSLNEKRFNLPISNVHFFAMLSLMCERACFFIDTSFRPGYYYF
jgi:hypothetical protein